jgi:hypothetical protein
MPAHETLIAVRSDVAEDLEYICTESECDIHTVLADLIAHMGDKDGAAIRIYHTHHQPQDDLEGPSILHHPEQEVDGDPYPDAL